MLNPYDDTYFMKQALHEAHQAQEKGEIPVGAVVVCQNRIIARGHNQTELLKDVTAHAEMIALGAASNFLGGKYLGDCTLYVTLEPCVMCAGALYWSQLGRLVYGAADDKRGFMRFGKTMLHPRTQVEFGVLMEECAELLKTFFQSKRS
ncbi:MAG TPA: nucleoside deaminase [Saprospiraceae bacterium]|nr:nucleoside deaminase [Saprospiraceae bacterium]HMQ82979.1 nucleoside deaminase [Saprospiraceae bacterium]